MAREKLSKAEIVENIYPLVKVSKKNIHRIIDFFFDQIKAGCSQDRIIELRGLGTFEIRTEKGARRAIPRPGTPSSSVTTAWRISGRGES